MNDDADRERLLGALRTLASFLREPQQSHDLILHTHTPDPGAVRRAIRAGKLPGSKIGRNYWIKRADLEAYVDSHRVAPKLRPAPTQDDDAMAVTREIAAAAGMRVKRR